MVPVRQYKGKKIAVFGLARSGLAAALALSEGGAEIVAWDDNQAQREAASNAGIQTANLYEADWSSIDLCILSPGVPLTHPAPHAIVTKARESNIEIVGDIELFAQEWEACEKRPNLICITGTNGKSTTTSLVGHVLRQAQRSVEVGGNIGEPALSLSGFDAHVGAYALEVSSYQLDLSPSLRPSISVLLNISPDHLDRHGGMEGYVDAKRKIFRNQGHGDVAIVSVDDPYCAEICTDISRNGIERVIPISVGKALSKGVYVVDGILFDGFESPCTEVLDLHECQNLKGEHNWQNAAAGFAVGRALGISTDMIARALRSFPGLPHRLELVGELDGVRFVNDSKATNVDAACRALSSFENVYWIAGGRSKSKALEPLHEFRDRIKKAFLIGEAAADFSNALASFTPSELSGDLASAVGAAFLEARRSSEQDPVVLLSPACASFDQFSDFEERGNAFKAAVDELMATQTRGGAAA